MKRFIIIFSCLVFTHVFVAAQSVLKPGFDANEYLQLLDVFDQQNSDTTKVPKVFPSLAGSEHVYKSPEVGLVNRFDVWLRPDHVGVICIRGTIGKSESWMENFYAAMIPAIGTLQLNDSMTFHYKFSADSNAKVHVGWTVGIGYMMPLITQQINLLYAKGVREFLIIGHSQGAGLAFLARSYLQYATEVPSDIIYKTYASAAPKPGNLYYAYDFDFITRGGWAMRVVNTLDWVPQTPFSIQTLADMNDPNPLANMKTLLGKQKWYVRWYLNAMFNKMNRSTRKAMERYRKNLGTKMYSMVKKSLTQFPKPTYEKSMEYMTTGTPIILMANDAYKAKFVYDGKNVFVHHLLAPYRYLVNTIYLSK